MKLRTLTILLLLLASITLVSAAEPPILKTTLLRYDPTPAQPGDYITAYIQIENTGGTAQRVRIEFKDSYPFSMDDENEKIADIGILLTGQTFVTDFQVRVDEDAVEGKNTIKFAVYPDYLSTVITEKTFAVTVQTQDADVALTNVQVTPKEINPGQKGKVVLTVENKADSTLTDVSSKITFQKTVGTTTTELPFAIEDSVSEKSVDVLRGGTSQIFEYSIIAFPSVSPGIYKLPLTLEFFDGTGQKYTKSEEITIIVNPKVALDVLIESSTLTKEIKKGDIDIRIVNKGFGELKFVNLVLKESDTYKLLTSYGATYIGNIDSDDYETADFQILAKKDTVDIPITLEYMDSLNKEYSVDKTLTLELHSSNGKSGGYWKLIFFLAIVAVVGYWFYKRKKKKRR